MFEFAGLEELKKCPNWVLWLKDSPRDKNGKEDKSPYSANANNPFKLTHASCESEIAPEGIGWATFEQARKVAESRKDCGLGFQFGLSPFSGVDIDNCIDDSGEIAPLALEIIEGLDSYTEFSPSGKGFHIIFKLSKPLSEYGPSLQNENIEGIKKLEIYDCKRYFRLTDKPFEGKIRPVRDCTEILGPIYEKFWGQENKEENKQSKPQNPPRPVFEDVFEGDNDLWARMFNAENGDKIRRLYNGDTSDYDNDDSRADFAMCSYLAFWTGNNPDEIDRLFRQSGLYRKKWCRQDYRDRTIAKAIATTFNVYTPQTQRTQEEEKGLHTLESYFNTSWPGDITKFQRQTGLKTGFSNIDRKMELYSGLYVIGAVSSLGKTTFCTQIADNIARAGRNVLYFSFEQSEFELASKCLTRFTAQREYNRLFAANPRGYVEIKAENFEKISTAVKARKGDFDSQALEEYKAIASHLYIQEMNFGSTIEDVAKIIENNLDKNPVVFVDYLQVIQPCKEDERKTTKEIIDKNVVRLKKLSADYNLVIFLISSLNRQNYLAPVDFEAFKESGIIEYTADVVIGLQLLCMRADIFDSDSRKNKKREIIRQAKKDNPRLLELTVLKNRYGESNASYFFSYYSAVDFFVPTYVFNSVNTAENGVEKYVGKINRSCDDTQGRK